MKAITAPEIKRRGMAAVDEALAGGEGPVHIIENDRSQYVVLTEEHYRDLLETQEEAALSRIKASIEDARAGRLTRHDSVAALMARLDSEGA